MSQTYNWKKYLDLHTKYCFSKATSKIIGIDVYVYLNDMYPSEFGTIFYNEWSKKLYKNEKQRPILEYNFSLNDNQCIDRLTTQEAMEFISSDIMKIGGKIRLSRFYKTTMYETNINIFNEKTTLKEQHFFKRLGQNILKYILQEMIPMIDDNEYITIEASGGKSEDDMRKLDQYYQSLGFIPVSFNSKYMSHAYKKAHLIMYSKIKGLTKGEK